MLPETRQYCIYTRDPSFGALCSWLQEHAIPYEHHLNRTRFWLVAPSPRHTEFMLRWYHCTSRVVDD